MRRLSLVHRVEVAPFTIDNLLSLAHYGPSAYSKLDRVRVMAVVSGVVDGLGVNYEKELSSRNVMQRASGLKYHEVSDNK